MASNLASSSLAAGLSASAISQSSASSSARPLVLVLGAGAQGLACALRLWEQGWDVIVCARDWLGDTTSAGAGAIWEYPPFQVEPQEKARKWVLASLDCFAAVGAAVGRDASGIRLRRSYYLFRSADEAEKRYSPSTWCDAVPYFKEQLPPEGLVPDGLYSHAFSYLAPIINMRRYLGWLTAELGELPGLSLRKVTLRNADDVADLAHDLGSSLLVNCLGLGARQVFGDERLYGVRGDLVYVLAPGAEERYNFAHISDEDAPDDKLTYIVPQGDGILGLAGSAVRLEPQQLSGAYRPAMIGSDVCEEVKGILQRNASVFAGAVLPPSPESGAGGTGADALVVGRWSGARPQREGGIRLEVEELKAMQARSSAFRCGHGDSSLEPLRIIHNYGHGGSGVVTSWGCAAEVASLATPLLPSSTRDKVRALPSGLAALAGEGLQERSAAALAAAAAVEAWGGQRCVSRTTSRL